MATVGGLGRLNKIIGSILRTRCHGVLGVFASLERWAEVKEPQPEKSRNPTRVTATPKTGWPISRVIFWMKQINSVYDSIKMKD